MVKIVVIFIIQNRNGGDMSRKGENIRKRKDGRWEARIQIATAAGETKYKSLYAKTYRDVKNKLLDARKNEEDKKVNGIERKVSDVAAEWLASTSMNRKESTKLKYSQIIETHIYPDLGNYNISSITEIDINNFLVMKLADGRIDKKGGLSSSYVKTMGIIINSILKYASERGYCKLFNSKIQKPIVEKKIINVMKASEQKNLEDKLKDDCSLTALGVNIALNTGLRIGEICALRWTDIDLTTGIIHIAQSVVRVKSTEPEGRLKTKLILDIPKTGTSKRDVPITAKLMKILMKAKKNTESPYVISYTDEFVSPRTFEYRFHKLLNKYNITDTNFHVLRHTFATRCVEAGVDIKSLSEMLGHANVGITLNTYVHSSIEMKRSQLEKLSLFCA